MLDDTNVLQQRDPHGALAVANDQWRQAQFAATVQEGDHDGRPLKRVVFAGMGGSALAAMLAKDWLDARLSLPFEIVKSYDLPAYVDGETLVIASSYSGNTEETLSCLQQARERSAQLGVIASGGHLLTITRHQSIAHVVVPSGVQPRMAVLYNLRATVALLVHFGVVEQSVFDEIAETADFLRTASSEWSASVPTAKNIAKQLAVLAAGKTPVIYGGALTGALAYKWKISWNENAKNVAFCNQYPEMNHNEFMGWVSHPIEKPFVVFDLISPLEHPQIIKRFAISDRLLSGKRPKAQVVELRGDTLLQQLLWGCLLADYVSIYVAILNGVDPVPVALIEKLKQALTG
ncbi:MAG: bifunctional phosphoglucose/phosphomannose isomerase [Candidatus Saccharimonadales bacterium]